MAERRYQKYERAVTVACVNYSTIWGDKAANLKKIKEMVDQAAHQGCNIIAFPELALSGYECDQPCTIHEMVAETIPGPATQEMAEHAARHDVYVIFGMPERDKDNPRVRYISSAVVGPEGVLGSYRKIHRGRPPRFTEAICFAGGQEVPVFETRYGLIGVLICYDFWMFPELSRILTLKDARIIFNTTASASGPGKSYFMVQQTGARATENMVYTASANLVGRELKLSYYGHSTIAGPTPARFVKIYAEGSEQEEIVTATLSLESLQFWRGKATWKTDRRRDLILKELGSLEQLKGGARAGP